MAFTEEDKNLVLQIKAACREIVKIGQTNKWGRQLPWEDMYITGGFFASCIQGESPKDVDFYFNYAENADSTVKYLQHWLQDKQTDISDDHDKIYRLVKYGDGSMVSEWAISLKSDFNQLMYSFIYKHYGDPHEMKKTFDYLHCMPHYDIRNDTLYISEAQLVAAKNKTLIINNKDNVTSERRQKFLKRGYTEQNTLNHVESVDEWKQLLEKNLSHAIQEEINRDLIKK